MWDRSEQGSGSHSGEREEMACIGLKTAFKLPPPPYTHPIQETAGSHRCGHQHACGRALWQCALRSHRAAEVAI